MPTVQFPKLLEHQKEVIRDPRPYKVLAWGAQCGKTRVSLYAQAAFALTHPGTRSDWIDRDGRFARENFRLAGNLLPAHLIKDRSKQDLFYILENGHQWSFFSGQEPDAFRGHKVESAVFNECAFIREEGWTEVLGPRLRGWAMFNSTPKGKRNWFYGLWEQAHKKPKRWFHSHMPTAMNPTIRPEILEDIKAQMPDVKYRQEILAEFVSDAGKLINPHPQFWTGNFEPYDPDGRYVAGIDWARVNDYSAWCIIRTDRTPNRLVSFGRLPHIDYIAQIPLLMETLREYGNPPTFADASERAANELMMQAGARLDEYRFTSKTKPYLVDLIRVACEQPRLLVPRADPSGRFAVGWTLQQNQAALDLQDEVENFEPRVTKGGIKYEASAGHHDDLLMALGLAIACGKESRSVSVDVIYANEERLWTQIP